MIVIDVKPLVGADPGESVPFEASAGHPKFEDLPAVGDLAVSGTVSKLDEGFLVAGKLAGTIRLECARCLKPFDHKVSLGFSEEFALDPGDEQFQAGKDRLELGPMLRAVILTSLPERPLHDPKCKGLCPVCGKDLGEEPHEHPETSGADGDDGHPFAKLKDLKRRQE